VKIAGALGFGRLLRRHRLYAGLSQEALAERASLSADAIGMLERGIRRMPYEQTIEALATALNLSENDRRMLALAARRARTRSRRKLGRLPLPTPLTPLIGRSKELATVRSWVAPGGPRLITITGTGGVGKTRFALQLAHDVSESFGGEVAFIGLSGLHDPTNIVSTILSCLDQKDDGTPASLKRLCAHVGKRRVLFVIDNLEQVLPGVPTLCEFLECCPEAVVIATSREALRVRGEHEFALQPLDLGSAVQLFEDRGRAVQPSLRFSPGDDTPVKICRRLDGLPLAIELAAARLRWESIDLLYEAVSSPLSALIFGGRDAPARQRTMRGAIDWSYHLLNAGERTIFCISSLFIGGGTLEAIAAVAAAAGSLSQDVDQTLRSLADKHLLRLVRTARQRGRFEMLEVIREYAREQLDSLACAAQCQRAFASHYLEVIERDACSRASAESSAWLELVAAEYMNLSAALRWASERDRPLGLRLALLLLEFWERKGCYAEARRWLEALAAPLEETIAREDPTTSWRAVTALALSCYWTADSQRSCALHERALTIARSRNDASATAKSLNNLGIALLDCGQAQRARQVLEESLALKEGRDDAWSIGSTVANLGIALRLSGDYRQALRCHRQARKLFRSVGDTWGEIGELNFIGDVYFDRREYRKAESCYAASLEANTEGIRTSVAHSLEGLMAIAAQRRRFGRAAFLAGTVARIRSETGQPESPSDAGRFREACAAARASLGDSAFEESLRAGAEMSLAEVTGGHSYWKL
jgi:predicted ATPase/transcriptional regulator with XRE-family HTH domain